MVVEENKNSFLKKPDISSIKSTIKKPLVSTILSNTYLGLLCYAIIFILGEILISGGKSERNIYFVIFTMIFLIAAQIVFISNKKYSSLKTTIISAVTVTLTIALLDYLLVNLWLEKNNLNIYKYWPSYLIYATALLVPFIRSNPQVFKLSNLKTLLTKKSRTL